MNFPNLYESSALRGVTGPAIRPGGLTLTERAMALCPLPPGARILDIGCGTGATIGHLNERFHLNPIGIDISALLLREGLERNPQLCVVCAEADHLPFPDRGFAALFCECVLSLMINPAETLVELSRILQPGGYLILADLYARVPESAEAVAQLPVHCCIRGAMAQERILALLRDRGFSIIVWEDHSALLKRLAAELIFTCGSLRAFWAGMCSEDYAETIQSPIRRAKPGYYLLIARRT